MLNRKFHVLLAAVDPYYNMTHKYIKRRGYGIV